MLLLLLLHLLLLPRLAERRRTAALEILRAAAQLLLHLHEAIASSRCWHSWLGCHVPKLILWVLLLHRVLFLQHLMMVLLLCCHTTTSTWLLIRDNFRRYAVLQSVTAASIILLSLMIIPIS